MKKDNVLINATTVTAEKQQAFHILSVSVALVTQHAKRMHSIISPIVTCRALPYFSTSSHKWHNFRLRGTEHTMHVLIFSTTFVCNISNSKKTKQHTIIYIHRSSCKMSIILVRF